MYRKLTAVGAVSLGLIVSACGDDAEHASRTGGGTPATPAGVATSTAETTFNDADVQFLQQMIPHHESALAMAELAIDPAHSASAEVVDLATRIRDAQQPEITEMTALLEAWGQPTETDAGHDTGSMGSIPDSTMPMEMPSVDMSSMENATGADFDHMWMDAMIQHHQGAIDMAEAVQAEGTNPDVRRLAGQIVTAQQAEIDEMRQLLDQ